MGNNFIPDNRMLEDLFVELQNKSLWEKYWRLKYLHLSKVCHRFMGVLPTIGDVETLLENEVIQTEETIKFIGFEQNDGLEIKEWLIHRSSPRFDFSGTINLPQAEAVFPSLVLLASELKEFFQGSINLQLFFARKEGGLPPHTDLNDSLIFQIAGKKRWIIEDLDEKSDLKEGNTGAQLSPSARSVVLEPGDALYKPSNAIHSTEHLDFPNLALTASIQTWTARDVLLAYLKISLTGDQKWMERWPLLADDPRREEIIEIISRASEELGQKLPSGEELEKWWRT
jgi:hypothetical protein